eukprot:4079647-Pyramimonas_sp.AAC.1
MEIEGLGLLEVSREPVGSVLEASGGIFGASWGIWEASWGPVGCPGHSGASLEARLIASGALLERHRGPSWCPFGPSWVLIRASSAVFGVG